MEFGLIFILLLNTDFRPNFKPYTIDYRLWPNFHPDAIDHGFWPNFHANTIDYGFRPHFHPHTIHHDIALDLILII